MAIYTGTATRKGTREHNCDAVAVAALGDLTALAVIDGIGDSPQVRDTSRLLAEVAARVAVRRGSLAGLLAAAECIASPTAIRTDPDAVGAVAVVRPDLEVVKVAWIGDVRAYGWDGTRLRQYTTDHTMGEQLRQNGAPWHVAEDHDNWVRLTLSRATVATIREVDIPDRRVFLTTDGIHDSTTGPELKALMDNREGGFPQITARFLTQLARADATGYRDDASAAVISRTMTDQEFDAWYGTTTPTSD